MYLLFRPLALPKCSLLNSRWFDLRYFARMSANENDFASAPFALSCAAAETERGSWEQSGNSLWLLDKWWWQNTINLLIIGVIKFCIMRSTLRAEDSATRRNNVFIFLASRRLVDWRKWEYEKWQPKPGTFNRGHITAWSAFRCYAAMARVRHCRRVSSSFTFVPNSRAMCLTRRNLPPPSLHYYFFSSSVRAACGEDGERGDNGSEIRKCSVFLLMESGSKSASGVHSRKSYAPRSESIEFARSTEMTGAPPRDMKMCQHLIIALAHTYIERVIEFWPLNSFSFRSLRKHVFHSLAFLRIQFGHTPTICVGGRLITSWTRRHSLFANTISSFDLPNDSSNYISLIGNNFRCITPSSAARARRLRSWSAQRKTYFCLPSLPHFPRTKENKLQRYGKSFLISDFSFSFAETSESSSK